MSTIEEIESAIERLPRDQFFQLLAWFKNRFEAEWDRKIETDIKAGKINQLASEALAEYRTGRTSSFPPDE